MDCESFKNIVFELASQELSAEETSKALCHISNCASCRKEYEETVKIVEALRLASEAEAPADLLPNVMKRIASDKSRRFSRMVRFCSAAAAAVILAAGVISLAPIIENRFKNDNETVESGEKVESVEPQKEKKAQTGAESAELGDTGESPSAHNSQTVQDSSAAAEAAPPAAEEPQAAASAASTPEPQPEASAQPTKPANETAPAANGEQQSAETFAAKNEKENVSTASNETPEPKTSSGSAKTAEPNSDIAVVSLTPQDSEPNGDLTATEGDLAMGGSAIVSPEVTTVERIPDSSKTGGVNSSSGGSARSGGSSGGSGGGGGSASYSGSGSFVAHTVSFSVSAVHAEAFEIDTTGMSRAEVEQKLNSMNIPFKAEVIDVDYTAEYRNAGAARRSEIERLCAAERCEIIKAEE